jgi:hypothetical protein
MQSDGGLTPMENFLGNRAILSGPAGGVVGYAMTSYHCAESNNPMPVIGESASYRSVRQDKNGLSLLNTVCPLMWCLFKPTNNRQKQYTRV